MFWFIGVGCFVGVFVFMEIFEFFVDFWLVFDFLGCLLLLGEDCIIMGFLMILVLLENDLLEFGFEFEIGFGMKKLLRNLYKFYLILIFGSKVVCKR